MTLIVDNRAALGSSRGLHAIISGVSYYEYLPGGGPREAARTFGLEQLTSPALSAYTFYRWLVDNEARLPAPIATVRVLLSSSDEELAVEPALAALGATRCTRENFQDEIAQWRQDAGSNSENIAFFYFCGHGVQRRADDTVILFEDFGMPNRPMLSKAADIDNIYLGMAPPKDPTKKIAQKQLYIVDACRLKPEEFDSSDWLNVPAIWDTESSVDDRTSPIFYAAIPGTEALGRPGKMSFFCEALINCLNGNGGDNLFDDASNSHKWQVTSLNLVTALKNELKDLNRKYGTSLNFEPAGKNKEMVLSYLTSLPIFDLSIEIDPDVAGSLLRVTVFDQLTNQPIRAAGPPLTSPHKVSVKPGLYNITAQITPPQAPYRDVSYSDTYYTPLKRVLKMRVI